MVIVSIHVVQQNPKQIDQDGLVVGWLVLQWDDRLFDGLFLFLFLFAKNNKQQTTNNKQQTS